MYDQGELRIGDFHVEPLAGLIRYVGDSGEQHHVQPKVMHVLIHLAEHSGDVVQRNDLIEAVWDRPVTDEVLTRAIYELRSAFNDPQGDPNYIQTIPKIGYRLIAPVDAINSEKSTAKSVDNQSDLQPEPPRIPWFRLALLGFGVVVAAVVGITILLHESRIEFVDNDRVVLAAFENYTDNPTFRNALGIAFRTGIEQSRKVTVMPPSAVRAALSRMQRKQEPIDRETAIEISLREQARGVIVASIASVGDFYRLSGEILEPQSGKTVFTYQSPIIAEDRILLGLDQVVTAIRQESGEALSSIEESAEPLEKVTTANFEALEAYSVGMQAAGFADLEVAIPLLEEATRLDPTFAMAYANVGFLQLVKADNHPEADWNLEKALEHRDRLTRREQLYVEALRLRNEKPSAQREAWNTLIYSYPNFADAYRNLGNVYHRHDNDFEKAQVELRKSVQIADSWNPVGFYNLAFVQLGLGNHAESLENFRNAWDLSGHPMTSGLAIAQIAAKNYADANEFLRINMAFPADNVRQMVEATSAIFFLDQGKFSQAEAATRKAMATASGDVGSEQRANVVRCAILEKGGSNEELAVCLKDVIAQEFALFEQGYRRPRYAPAANLTFLGKIAARNGMSTEANAILDAVTTKTHEPGYYFIDAYAMILEVELLIGTGAYLEAVELLRSRMDSRALFQAHESLARAQALAGNVQEAIKEYQWLIDNRGRAFSEQLSRRYGNEINILDWAAAHFHLGQLYEQEGRTKDAELAYQALLDHWSGADVSIPIMALATERIRAFSPGAESAIP